jgi:D-2-hydroxyacid dehydrogenase (NADP+)
MKLFIYHTPYSNPFRPLTDAHLEKIRDAVPGIEVVATEADGETGQHIADADIIAGYPMRLSQLDISRAQKLRWLHSFSAGMDRVLTPAVVASGIVVSNSSGVAAIPIAEHMMGMILAWNRRFMKAFQAQQAHDWQRLEATELTGKTVLVVGLGAIGTEFARLLRAFNTRTIGVVRTRRPVVPTEVDELITDKELDDRLGEADIVAICLPGNKETHHRFGTAQFAKMKPTAVIQNIGRGSIINEAALIEALEAKTIAGALLDVTEVEPLPPTSPLWDRKNVFITGHYSASSEKAMDRTIDRFIENLKAFVKDKQLPNAVDKTLGY